MNIMKLLGQVPVRMGQINPYGYSWNFAPATGYMPVIPNTYGGAPAAVPDVPEEVAAGSGCFTCTNPSSGDTQYGVPSAMATQLKGQGYKCRADECANRTMFQAGHFGGLMDTPSIEQAISTPQNFGYVSSPGDSGMMLMGRIPLAGGLGRRALT
jgi:hypothetical protein